MTKISYAMILLQAGPPVNPEKYLDRNFNVSPDTVLGLYVGTLAMLLIVAGWVIYKLYQARERDKNSLMDSEKKSTEVFNGLLQSNSQLNLTLQAINTSLGSIKEMLTEKFRELKDEIKELEKP